MIFLIMFSSTVIQSAIFLDQTIEKGENIKDILDFFNPSFILTRIIENLWVFDLSTVTIYNKIYYIQKKIIGYIFCSP